MRAVLSFGARKHRHFLIVAGVTLVALTAIVMVPSHSQVAPAVVLPAPAPLQMMVAARPIASGTVIVPADMRAKTIAGMAPLGAILSGDSALGHIAEKSFATGDMLTDADLRDAAAAGIAGHVATGQRAYSIRVAEDEIVGGFLQSADHVDIFATIPGSVFASKDAQDHADRSQAVLLLQNILVLAVGENLATRGAVQTTARTVSLSLTPAQLARLTLALRFGKVSLAIRNPGDDAVSASAPVTLADIVPDVASAGARPSAPARKKNAGIPFLSGTHVSFVHGRGAP